MESEVWIQTLFNNNQSLNLASRSLSHPDIINLKKSIRELFSCMPLMSVLNSGRTFPPPPPRKMWDFILINGLEVQFLPGTSQCLVCFWKLTSNLIWYFWTKIFPNELNVEGMLHTFQSFFEWTSNLYFKFLKENLSEQIEDYCSDC